MAAATRIIFNRDILYPLNLHMTDLQFTTKRESGTTAGIIDARAEVE